MKAVHKYIQIVVMLTATLIVRPTALGSDGTSCRNVFTAEPVTTALQTRSENLKLIFEQAKDDNRSGFRNLRPAHLEALTELAVKVVADPTTMAVVIWEDLKTLNGEFSKDAARLRDIYTVFLFFNHAKRFEDKIRAFRRNLNSGLPMSYGSSHFTQEFGELPMELYSAIQKETECIFLFNSSELPLRLFAKKFLSLAISEIHSNDVSLIRNLLNIEDSFWSQMFVLSFDDVNGEAELIAALFPEKLSVSEFKTLYKAILRIDAPVETRKLWFTILLKNWTKHNNQSWNNNISISRYDGKDEQMVVFFGVVSELRLWDYFRIY